MGTQARSFSHTATPPTLSPQAVRWLVCALLFTVIEFWAHVSGMSATFDRPGTVIIVVTVLFAVLFHARKYDMAGDVFQAWAQIFLFATLLNAVGCLVISLRAPLQDARLARCDHILNLDWMALWRWMAAHPQVRHALRPIYNNAPFEMLGVPVLLRSLRRKRKAEQFVWAFAISLFLTVTIGGLLPAYGAGHFYGVEEPGWVGSFEALRTGHADVLQNFSSICLPSYHMAMALLAMWGLRSVRVLFAFAIAINLANIIATPIEGSHYFVDLLGGVIVTWVAISLAKRLETAFSSV